MLVIVDYDAGNLRSVNRAVEHAGASPVVTSDPEMLRRASAVILPGVGAAGDAMESLRRLGLVEPLRESIQRGTPFLGVCLGLQLLLELSEEKGQHACLGVFPGTVRPLPAGVKVPHMGWNAVDLAYEHPVFDGIASGSFFYFVHSFYADVAAPEAVLGTTEYAGLRFPSVLARDNVVATQFHPEKSSTMGLRVYENFWHWASR